MCVELRGFSDFVLHLCVELLRVIISVHLCFVNYYLAENTAKQFFGSSAWIPHILAMRVEWQSLDVFRNLNLGPSPSLFIWVTGDVLCC